MTRGALLVLLALLPAAAWAQDYAPFEPVVRAHAYIVEAPADLVRALAGRIWPDVPFTEADPDRTARWTVYVAEHERGSHVRLAHYVTSRESLARGALFEQMRMLADSLARPPLSATTHSIPADGDLSCLDVLMPTPRFPNGAQVTAEGDTVRFAIVDRVPELLPNMQDGMAALQERAVYPEALKRQGVEGRVFVQFIVDERGGPPTCLVVARSVHPVLDDIAAEAVSTVRFRPLRHRTRRPPIQIKLAMPVDFCLNGLQRSNELYKPARCAPASSQR